MNNIIMSLDPFTRGSRRRIKLLPTTLRSINNIICLIFKIYKLWIIIVGTYNKSRRLFSTNSIFLYFWYFIYLCNISTWFVVFIIVYCLILYNVSTYTLQQTEYMIKILKRIIVINIKISTITDWVTQGDFLSNGTTDFTVYVLYTVRLYRVIFIFIAIQQLFTTILSKMLVFSVFYIYNIFKILHVFHIS